ncbi:hypothetical protein BBJ28_00025217, partial [Nothophytophthora sp. Chile5]
MTLTDSSSCTASDCSAVFIGSSTYYSSTSCPSNAYSYATKTYGSAAYVLVDTYSESTCQTYVGTGVFLATGECEVAGTDGEGVICTMYGNGTVQIQLFLDSSCSSAITESHTLSEQLTTSHTCYLGYKFYSNFGGANTDGVTSGSGSTSSGSTTQGTTTTEGSSSSGLSGGVIAGIVVGCVVLLALVFVVIFCCCRRRNKEQNQAYVDVDVDVPSPGIFGRAADLTTPFQQPLASPPKVNTGSDTLSSSQGQAAMKLWDDEVIIAARIPREKVIVQQLINRGGYGEVYAGSYNGQRVAIKMLLPERKKSI